MLHKFIKHKWNSGNKLHYEVRKSFNYKIHKLVHIFLSASMKRSKFHLHTSFNLTYIISLNEWLDCKQIFWSIEKLSNQQKIILYTLKIALKKFNAVSFEKLLELSKIHFTRNRLFIFNHHWWCWMENHADDIHIINDSRLINWNSYR